MNLTASELSALELDGVRVGFFLRLAVAPPLRCWLGAGPVAVGINVLDADEEIYSGFGELISLPAMSQLINGAADRVELALSGIDDRILALADFAEPVKGVGCDIGFGLFDTDWSFLGAVHWLRHFVADYLALSIAGANEPTGQTLKTATLSIGSLMTGRRRRGLSYFNNQDQQVRARALNPTLTTDRFCERTVRYSIRGAKTWPKFA